MAVSRFQYLDGIDCHKLFQWSTLLQPYDISPGAYRNKLSRFMSKNDYIILIRLLSELALYYICPGSECNNNSSGLCADIQVIKIPKTRGKDGEMKDKEARQGRMQKTKQKGPCRSNL